MKYSIKKHFKRLFEMQAQHFQSPETDHYIYDFSSSNDYTENDFLEQTVRDMFDKKLKDSTYIDFKTDSGETKQFDIKVKDFFTLMFIMIKENLISKQDMSLIIEASILNKANAATIDLTNWTGDDIITRRSNPTPDQLVNSRSTGSPKKKSGGGDELLTSVINSNSQVEFLDNILVLLYRKLVAKKSITIDSNRQLSGEFNDALNLILNTFRDKIKNKQASLSTTFGATFELLINSAVQAFFEDKLYKFNKDSYSFSEDFNDNNVDLASYIDKGTVSDIVSKKITILLLLFFTGKFSGNNVIYKHYADTESSQLSQENWHNAYAEVFDSIKKQEINKISRLMVDYSKKLLEYKHDSEFGRLQKRNSRIFCDEYESDKELYDAARDSQPSLYLPKKNAPFDFIIRTVQQDNEPIAFGLFDLKCANNKVKGSTAYDTRKTGNNKSNSAIFNIQNTLKALDAMSGNNSVLKFIGLSELQYELIVTNSEISLTLTQLRNICGSPNSSINECIDKPHMKITRDGDNRLDNISQEDYITLENLASKNITFVKYLNEIGHARDFALKLLEAGYNGNFNGSNNYLSLVDIGYTYIEVLMKIKNEEIYNSLKQKLEVNLDEEKNKVLYVLDLVKEDNTFDIKEISKDILENLAFKENNDVNKSILNIASTNSRTNAKRKLASDVLSVFGNRSKHANYENYINVLDDCPLKKKQKAKANKASNPDESSEGKSIGNDFYFSMTKSDYAASNKQTELENILKPIKEKIDVIAAKVISDYNSESSDVEQQADSYAPRGKMLKEVYSHLFKKKSLNEGGLAGHMMHPYEALDMTPKQIKDRIKKYSTSQKIIEKVDGQNLFFTVEEDGTLMFARNKEDMTHNDLVEKFTNHPAEVPFVSGGNAIKRGVDQWLSSAGAFGQQEILEIFHPDGEARSFINFEIMHKDHPNQLEYGENFIVFHSIVDFIDGREAVYSSNNSQRLNKLIKLMKPGVESSDYTLASNRTVDLNSLTNVQISDYINRINRVMQMLDITDNEYLGDGVEKQIKKELDAEGITISDEAIKILYDFALYGEDRLGNKIKSKDFTSLMAPEDVIKLRSIGLTNASKAAAKVRSILSPFKDVFVDLGIDLLDGVASSYMSMDIDLANIDKLRDKLQTAIDDLRAYMTNTPEEEWEPTVKRLKQHYDKVERTGVFDTVSTSVEGGVYDHEGDLLKVTGGFAPLNQILGAAYRDKKGIFPSFKEKFMQQESNRRSLRSVFSSIF